MNGASKMDGMGKMKLVKMQTKTMLLNLLCWTIPAKCKDSLVLFQYTKISEVIWHSGFYKCWLVCHAILLENIPIS